jgi:hypothetical protein
MSYNIDQLKVQGVMHECARVVSGKGFNAGEIVVGLTELLGRIVVDTATNHIAMKDMVRVIEEHLDRTITVGSQAQEKSLIERI